MLPEGPLPTILLSTPSLCPPTPQAPRSPNPLMPELGLDSRSLLFSQRCLQSLKEKFPLFSLEPKPLAFLSWQLHLWSHFVSLHVRPCQMLFKRRGCGKDPGSLRGASSKAWAQNCRLCNHGSLGRAVRKNVWLDAGGQAWEPICSNTISM